MKKQIRKKTIRVRCRHCQQYFYVEPRRHGHSRSQKYCDKNDCKQESHRMSAKRYRDKKKDDASFKANEIIRVTKWQNDNPGYKTRQRRKKSRNNSSEQKKVEKNFVLRDLALTQIEEQILVLRDLLKRLELILKGFIAEHHNVLRDEIYGLECRLYDRGLELSGMVPGGINL